MMIRTSRSDSDDGKNNDDSNERILTNLTYWYEQDCKEQEVRKLFADETTTLEAMCGNMIPFF